MDSHLIGVKADCKHSNNSKDKRRSSQSVSCIAVEAESTNHRREEVDHGAVDVAQVEYGHEEPCLCVLASHDQTLPGSDLIGVVLLTEIFLEVPLNPFALNG